MISDVRTRSWSNWQIRTEAIRRWELNFLIVNKLQVSDSHSLRHFGIKNILGDVTYVISFGAVGSVEYFMSAQCPRATFRKFTNDKNKTFLIKVKHTNWHCFLERLNGVDRQPSNGLKFNRQPSKNQLLLAVKWSVFQISIFQLLIPDCGLSKNLFIWYNYASMFPIQFTVFSTHLLLNWH